MLIFSSFSSSQVKPSVVGYVWYKFALHNMFLQPKTQQPSRHKWWLAKYEINIMKNESEPNQTEEMQ
jgi:hypothetical protein